ncbi:MAG TPA: BON domain-containing protein [Burkholderiaceae bacterium]
MSRPTVDRPLPARLLAASLVAALLAACAPPLRAQAAAAATPASSSAERRNWFDDPFLQATHGLPGCPVPDPPLMTEAEMQHETHWRAERGTSCFRSGRCRLPNAYLYDKEIAPRVVRMIRASGAFEDTTVWVEGQRRWVWLKGCVSTQAQADEMERQVRLVDDVEAVIPQLIVGTAMPPGPPRYRLPPGPVAASAPADR